LLVVQVVVVQVLVDGLVAVEVQEDFLLDRVSVLLRELLIESLLVLAVLVVQVVLVVAIHQEQEGQTVLIQAYSLQVQEQHYFLGELVEVAVVEVTLVQTLGQERQVALLEVM
jgi:hypothetical protein